MPRSYLNKGKQPSAEPDPEDRNSQGSSSGGEKGGELVPATDSNAGLASPFISGFSAQQVNEITTFVRGILLAEWDRKVDQFHAGLDQRFDRMLEAIQSGPSDQNNQSANQYLNQQLDSQQYPTSSPSVQATITTAKPEIRAEEVGYFDPEYQQERGTKTSGPVVNAGKHVYYRDVYVFIDRLKDLANQRNAITIKTSGHCVPTRLSIDVVLSGVD